MNSTAHYISIVGRFNGPFLHTAIFIYLFIYLFFTRQRLLEEEEQEDEEEEEERADHVFPLLTSPLWHVHTWFSLECCFCGIADGKPAGGFIWGEEV